MSSTDTDHDTQHAHTRAHHAHMHTHAHMLTRTLTRTHTRTHHTHLNSSPCWGASRCCCCCRWVVTNQAHTLSRALYLSRRLQHAHTHKSMRHSTTDKCIRRKQRKRTPKTQSTGEEACCRRRAASLARRFGGRPQGRPRTCGPCLLRSLTPHVS